MRQYGNRCAEKNDTHNMPRPTTLVMKITHLFIGFKEVSNLDMHRKSHFAKYARALKNQNDLD